MERRTFKAYRQTESNQQIWNLPDGRTVRVVSNPHPQGGVTWLYENLTEKIDLERRYNTLIKIQGETLDKLSEGVVVLVLMDAFVYRILPCRNCGRFLII